MDRKEYDRLYALKNREKRRLKSAEYYKNNKNNLNVKSMRISKWKQQGILCYDYNLLYKLYSECEKCEYCNIELKGKGRQKKCLDHDHNITDKFNVRGVLCNVCNIRDVLN